MVAVEHDLGCSVPPGGNVLSENLLLDLVSSGEFAGHANQAEVAYFGIAGQVEQDV